MNGGSLVMLISVPLRNPIRPPASTPSSSASPHGVPWAISWAVITPLSAITEPTDRSIPASRMAKNSPRASRIVIAPWSVIRSRLSPVMKIGSITLNTATMRARIATVEYLPQ